MWEECATSAEDEAETLPLEPTQQVHPQHAAWSFSLPWPLSSLTRQHSSTFSGGNTAQSKTINPSTASFAGMSLPYIPPEVFEHHFSAYTHQDNKEAYDPRPADVWATAIIYMTLITGRLLWRCARPRREDGRYLEYLQSRREQDGYAPIESLGQVRITPNRTCIPHKKQHADNESIETM
jgi:serine/threonine protein kinase